MNFSIEPSILVERDSICSVGSQQAEDSNHSLRSSFYGTNKSFSRSNEKKVLVDKRLLAKLINFLKNVVKELNIDDKEIQMIEKFIQTDEDEHQKYNKNPHKILNESNLEEALELQDTLEKLKLENENYKTKINTYHNLNIDLNDKITYMNGINEINFIEKEELNQEIKKLREELDNLKSLSNNKTSLREEVPKDSIKVNNETDRSKHLEDSQDKLNNPTSKSSDFNLGIFQNDSILKDIVSFLQPKEFYNFYYSSKSIHSVFKKEDLHINILKYTIELKNLELKNLKSIDWIREYEISESEVERLVREYIQNNKVPGCELKGMLVKALSYIDREIKKPLGVKDQEKTERKSSLLGSLNTMFSKMMKKKDETNLNLLPKKSITLNGTYENIDDYDKSLLDLQNNNDLDFDYASSDEIKSLLVQFFTSLKNSPQVISNFIAELINEYADFLFYSQKTLQEIREMDLVKHSMHERFKKYHKICIELENELDDLQKLSKTNKEIKDILLKQKQEVEVKYVDSVTQITHLKDELNKTANKLMSISEKYNRAETEYEAFKSKLVKEFKYLKNEYENVGKERDVLKEAIWEFKKYFMRFHITDDGDITYIDES